MVTLVSDPNIDAKFPAAAADGYDLRSPYDPVYNCIAWAAGEMNIWWWPTPAPVPGVYWPQGVPRDQTLGAFMAAYATLGYKDCGTNRRLEPRFEKIAIYATPDLKPQHAVRQLADGLWTSKLGPYRDIHHTSAAAVTSGPPPEGNYGAVVRYMKRRRRPSHQPLREPGVPDVVPPTAFSKYGVLGDLWARVFK